MRKLSTINYPISTSKGLTLVELLVVIGVIAILASVMVFVIDPITQFKKGRDTRRKADLSQIQAALEFYRADQGYYPSSLPSCGNPFTSGTTTYLAKVPCDPTASPPYTYTPSPSACTTTCTSYELYACLEIVTDLVADGIDGSASDKCPLPAGSPADGRVSMTVKNP